MDDGGNYHKGKGDVKYLGGDMTFSMGGKKYADGWEQTFGRHIPSDDGYEWWKWRDDLVRETGCSLAAMTIAHAAIELEITTDPAEAPGDCKYYCVVCFEPLGEGTEGECFSICDDCWDDAYNR